MVPIICLTYLSQRSFMRWFFFWSLLFVFFSCDKKNDQSRNIVNNNPAYDLAFDFREAGYIDSALVYFYLAKNVFEQQGDLFGVGKCLNNMAIIITDRGDYYGGQETGLEAIQYFDA